MSKNILIKNVPLTALLLSLLLGFSGITQAVEYGGVGGRPANPDPTNSRTESIFVHTISPGGTLQDAIRLINNTSETKTLRVYAVDSLVSSGGAFACAQELEPKKGSGSWITLSKSEVTLLSLTNEVVPFTITLPENASTGEHNGCIVVQEKEDPATNEDKTGIVLSFRTGIRVAILVPGEIIRKLEIGTITATKKENGDITFNPKVKNTGNVSIDAGINVVIKNMFGFTSDKLGGEYPVLRGEESEYNLDFKKPFWGGWYRAFYTVEYDPSMQAGVGTKSGEAPIILSASPIKIFSTPEPAAIAIELAILLLILILLILFIISRRRASWIKHHWQPHTVAHGEEMVDIAKRYNVSWKLLAKINKIEAPYVLSQGQVISVPPKQK